MRVINLTFNLVHAKMNNRNECVCAFFRFLSCLYGKNRDAIVLNKKKRGIWHNEENLQFASICISIWHFLECSYYYCYLWNFYNLWHFNFRIKKTNVLKNYRSGSELTYLLKLLGRSMNYDWIFQFRTSSIRTYLIR